MAGKFEIYKDKAGEHRFRLKAGNGQNILASEGYKSKSSCANGIKSVQSNCGDDNCFERKETKSGKHYFVLKARNHQVIGRSQLYASAASLESGIASVRRACAGETGSVSDRVKDSAFVDLGFSEEEATVMVMRSELAIEIEKFIKRRGYNQTQAAKFFGITQSKISDIVNGKIHSYSVEFLAKLAAKAGKTPRITFSLTRALAKPSSMGQRATR